MNELEKRAEAHKKKNKGLSRYCYLNPNAGNVEHNVDMFNKMNSPTDGPTNNPISGPFGGDVSAPASSGGVAESLQEALVPQTAYMLRNDKKLISMGKAAHPYILADRSSTIFQQIRQLFISRPEDIVWFYNNTAKEQTKKLIDMFVVAAAKLQLKYNIHLDPSLVELFNLQEIEQFDIYDDTIDTIVSDFEHLAQAVTMHTNQEFCRIRTSDLFVSKGQNRDIYFRISSVDFNWFELIWELVYDNKNWIESVTITADMAAKGSDKAYSHNGTIIYRLPTEEFLNLSGRPVVESISNHFTDYPYGDNIFKLYHPKNIVTRSHMLFEDFVNEYFVPIQYQERQEDSMIELEYKNVPVIEYGAKRDVDDWDEIERHIDYTYKIDKDTVAECLTDIVAEQEPELVFAMTDEQFDNWIDEHFDEYLKKYHDMVKEFYYEDAQHEAQETFDPSEHFVESVETTQGKYGHEFDSLYRLMQAQHLVYLFHQGTLLDTLLAPYFDGDLTVFETFAKAPEDVQFRVIEAMKKALHAHAESLDDNFDMWLGNYDV